MSFFSFQEDQVFNSDRICLQPKVDYLHSKGPNLIRQPTSYFQYSPGNLVEAKHLMRPLSQRYQDCMDGGANVI